MISLPILLDGYDVTPCPDGDLLDKAQIVRWLEDITESCNSLNDYKAEILTLLDYLTYRE